MSEVISTSSSCTYISLGHNSDYRIGTRDNINMTSDNPIAWTLPEYEATTIENDGVSTSIAYSMIPQLTMVDTGEQI
jgi:hypothetical protein